MTTTENGSLNTKQLELLRLLYRFRFATTTHLLTSLNLTNLNTIYERLNILLEQQYIARNYDGQYKIHGRPAEYYLLDNGIRALKRQIPDKCDAKVLHSLYNDKRAKDQAIAHHLAVFTIHCQLKQRYGEQLRFFMRNQVAPYRHFPKQKPDALIRLDTDDGRKEFFLEVLHTSKPFFPYVGRVRRYIEYADGGAWQGETPGSKLPVILAVCDSVGLEIRFRKQAARFLTKHYDKEPKVFTTNTNKLVTIKPGYDRVWRDVEESEQAIALHEIER